MVAPLRAVALGELKPFDLSPERGFLPAEDPLRALPAGFEPWEQAAEDLPRLLVSGRVRSFLGQLPQLAAEGLATEAELRRAMRLLSFLGHAWVWGEDVPARSLPARLAVPWTEVAGRLGRPPVLSYASYALDNWRRLDADGPLELGNLAVLSNFLGGADEDWFIGVHIEIEARAARVLRELGPALAAVACADRAELARHLGEIALGLEDLVSTLQRMPERCDPYVYYHRVRPFIHGWKDQPALPDGLVYEGVAAFAGKPQCFRGETGAQSGVVPALDAALGIAHADDPLRPYLREMRAYMPPGHRAFIAALEGGPSIRQLVQASVESAPELCESYDECLRWLEAFRAMHLEYAVRYVGRQRSCAVSNPTTRGTGGTPFLPYLRKHRDETGRHRLGPT